FECDTDIIQACWSIDVSPNGRYIIFGGLAKNLPAAEVAWIIDLEDASAAPILLEDGGVAPARFINNETVAYWSYPEEAVVTYDIATCEIAPTGFNIYEPRFSTDGSRLANSGLNVETDDLKFNDTVLNLETDTETTFVSPSGEP